MSIAKYVRNTLAAGALTLGATFVPGYLANAADPKDVDLVNAHIEVLDVVGLKGILYSTPKWECLFDYTPIPEELCLVVHKKGERQSFVIHDTGMKGKINEVEMVFDNSRRVDRYVRSMSFSRKDDEKLFKEMQALYDREIKRQADGIRAEVKRGDELRAAIDRAEMAMENYKDERKAELRAEIERRWKNKSKSN